LLIASLESQLANSVSADAIESLKQKHAEELQGLQTQAARAQELETELTKARGAESSLQLEFDRQLAKEKGILSAKYDSEVDELHVSLESKVEGRDAEINELKALWKLDSERYDNEISVWHARDCKLQFGLLGLEHALHGKLASLFPSFCSFTLFPHSLIALAEAFPGFDGVAAAALEEYRAEQEIVPSSDPKAQLSSGELMASIKGRLHPIAKLGGDLRQAAVSVFRTFWPGRAVPNEVQALIKWIPLASNRVDVWKESAARAGAEQALEFVLSWYPCVNLDQLENLCEGGSAGLEKAKLHQRACAIAECTETDVLFDVGDSDESLDGVDFEEPSSAEEPQKAPEDLTDNSIPPSPSGDDFVLAARTGDAAPLEPAGSPSAPDSVRTSLFVCMHVELMPCPMTFRSCTPMIFHPKSLTYWFLVVYEPDLA
jgi:hypothetical protein